MCRADQQERESQAKQAFDRLGTELQQQQQQQFAEHAARSDAEFSKAHPEYSDPVKREEMETRTLN